MATARSILSIAAVFGPLLFHATAGSVSRCKGDQSCPNDGSRTGGALLQAHVDADAVSGDNIREFGVRKASRTTGMALKTRVGGVETAIAQLKAKMSKLQTEVSGKSDIEGGAADAAGADSGEEFPTLDLDLATIASSRSSAKHDRGSSLSSEAADEAAAETHATPKLSLVAASTSETLQQESAEEAEALKQDPTLKERVAVAEKDLAELKSKLSTLENEVMGTTFTMKLSLLEERGSSLKSRIVSIEEEVDSLRSRVSTLEHNVIG